MPVAAVATAGAVAYAMAMIWLRKIGPGESHEAVVLHFSLVAMGACSWWLFPCGAGPIGRTAYTCSGPAEAAVVVRWR